MPPFSRDNPSPDYASLIALYERMHREGFSRDTDVTGDKTDPEHAFPGQSLHRWLLHISSLITVTGAQTVLDYGSGKGQQYEKPVQNGGDILAPSIQDLWDVEDVVCFDPGVSELNVLPTKTFDAVIATDVLEHVPESDVFWVVDELFSLAGKFVFASIPCYRAAATLPDGRNAHITIRPPLWWLGVFQSAQSRKPDVQFSTAYLIPVKGQESQKKIEFLHSFDSASIDFSMLDHGPG